VSAPFFDPLWVHILPGASLLGAIASVLLASALCFLLFYGPTASWGFRTGRPLSIVAASTFGTRGSDWITGVGIGVAQVVWYAAAIDYAIESTLLGLVASRLLPFEILHGWNLGPFMVKSPVFLCTAVFWIFVTGMASLLRLIGVIAALMRVYAPVALLLLTLTALCLAPGLSALPPDRAAAQWSAPAAAPSAPLHPDDAAVPMILGFFAVSGLLATDWGAACRSHRDVVVGGLAGIVLAGSWSASMALLSVAGAVGRLNDATGWAHIAAPDPPILSFRWAVFFGIGGYAGGAILILFGLAALAPACYCAWIFSRRFSAHWPGVRRFTWTWLGGAAALLLIATSYAGRLASIDYAMGLVFAPALGAMAGDFLGQRGDWHGLRDGVNPPGMIAWILGILMQQALDFAMTPGHSLAGGLLSTPLAGFLTAGILYRLLASAGMEGKPIPVPSDEPGNDAARARSTRMAATGASSERAIRSEPPTT
jgi:hypothetical protein